jgi:hypothetical protein
MDRSLSDDTHRILSDNVERRENTVSPLCAERIEQSLSSHVGAVSGRLLIFELDLAADTSDTVEQLSGERDGRLLGYTSAFFSGTSYLCLL